MRGLTSGRAVALAAVVLVGCGSGATAAPSPEALFADASLRARAEAAPELLREAEAALARARAATDGEAASDHATEARLLFLAAVAEGERRGVAPSAPAPGAAGALDRAGVDDAAIRRHALAVALASSQAEAVTEAARELEETRWRSREEALVAARRAALDAVVARTRILIGALAGPLAVEATEVAALGGRLEELRAVRDPTLALDGVDRLRRELEARVSRPGGGREVVAAAVGEGLVAEPIDGLWVVDLGPPSRASSFADIPGAARLLTRLGARPFLLVAEGPPRGAVERALGPAEAALLGAGVAPDRVTTLAVTSASFGETRLSLRFVDYPPP